MYAFKRIIAFSIDYALMFFATGLLYGFTAKKLSPLLQKTEILAAYSHSALSVGILMLLPILVLGTLSGAL